MVHRRWQAVVAGLLVACMATLALALLAAPVALDARGQPPSQPPGRPHPAGQPSAAAASQPPSQPPPPSLSPVPAAGPQPPRTAAVVAPGPADCPPGSGRSGSGCVCAPGFEPNVADPAGAPRRPPSLRRITSIRERALPRAAR